MDTDQVSSDKGDYVQELRMCSVLEFGGTEWDGSIPRA
jgi:hypothetical protein